MVMRRGRRTAEPHSMPPSPPSPFASEARLIEGLIARDEGAFRYAITTFQPSMLHLARSIVGQKIADEVVQEAWLSAMGAIARFEQRSALKTWLLRIVTNEARTRLRKERRTVSLEGLSAEGSELESRFDDHGHWLAEAAPGEWTEDAPDDLLSSDELSACMERTLASLPDMQSATLRLREHQGYSLAEICNILDVSESNVRVLLHRARSRLFTTVEHFKSTGECLTR